jgi:UDP-glucose 4-epimerase
MRICVTGSAGFVGRRFVSRFLESDDNEVIGIDNMSNGLPLNKWMFQPEHKQNLTFKYMDVRDLAREKIDPSQFDLVVHCAATVGGRRLIDGDPILVSTNMAVDASLFDWIVRAKSPPKLVYFSSSAVYPRELQSRSRNCALCEHHLTVGGDRLGLPEASYGFSKLAGEYMARLATERYGLDVRVYRPFGGYGEDQDSDYPFPSIIRRVLNRENPIIVWGSGEQKRDFVHIDDVVDCVLETMGYENISPLNIGTGIGVSFVKLAQLAGEVLNIKVKVLADLNKPEGVFARVADPFKLHRVWNHKVDLEDGIKRVASALEKVAA